MSDGIFIEELSFNDDTTIKISENSIVLITGPNNSGKSQILRDISSILSGSLVVSSMSFDFKGDMKALVESAILDSYGIGYDHIVEKAMSYWQGDIVSFLESLSTHVTAIKMEEHLLQYVSTDSRTSGVEPSERTMDENPIFRSIHESKKLEKKLHDLIKATFGTGITANRESFNDRGLRFISENDVDANSPQRGEPEFARWLEAQPELQVQGDGVRAFCTVILTILTQAKPLILIDEPEAFLHPPQARRLARAIALDTPLNTQVFIATHSNEFVQGLLDYANERVVVLRVVRNTRGAPGKNKIFPLNSDEVSEFWKDPLLKTSDALTSLFHDVAVIVEGDSDARFFRAMFDAVFKDTVEYLPDMRFFIAVAKIELRKLLLHYDLLVSQLYAS